MSQVINMRQMERKLQKADRKQARLYLFCNFMALMIISAYSALMLSPTVQKVFPEGGDSAKQMYMIFVMTLVGCVVFTIYALGLFFRHKSGQLGILMALGASRKRAGIVSGSDRFKRCVSHCRDGGRISLCVDDLAGFSIASGGQLGNGSYL